MSATSYYGRIKFSWRRLLEPEFRWIFQTGYNLFWLCSQCNCSKQINVHNNAGHLPSTYVYQFMKSVRHSESYLLICVDTHVGLSYLLLKILLYSHLYSLFFVFLFSFRFKSWSFIVWIFDKLQNLIYSRKNKGYNRKHYIRFNLLRSFKLSVYNMFSKKKNPRTAKTTI